jgi:hypothetical protein
LSYLRLTIAEYRVVRRECVRLNLGRSSRSAFRRGLVTALAAKATPVARKIASLRRSELRLLHEHFTEPFETITPNEPAELSPDEWVAFAQACVSYPLPIRFVRPFRHMLVDLFRDVSPDLARKLERLSASQFEQLYGEATERPKGST